MRPSALIPALLISMLSAAPSAAQAAAETSVAEGTTLESTASAEAPAAIFVVRHAEKEKGSDPSLTDAGRERARQLVQLLDAAGIDAVYATQWRRTRETAAPIAEALGLDIRIVETAPGFESELAAKIRREHAGEVVLVVGHSNTNPTLLGALGVPEPPAISEDDYDDVYLVIYPQIEPQIDPEIDIGEPRLLRLGYGRPTP